MTQEERHLWYDFLKGLSVTIHRQKVIRNYIVDFYCAQAKLVIEVDGSQHYEKNAIEQDAIRDQNLREIGFKVKRYSNIDIKNNFGDVCAEIYRLIYPEEE
jgi:very-short-patch-repair endonuclease